MYKTTFISAEKFNTRRKLANRALKAMSDICDYSNGTIRNPYELASSSMKDGRTLIQTIYEDGYVMYNNGWYVVEVDEDAFIYIDFTGIAMREMKDELEEKGLEEISDYEWEEDY